MIARQRAIDAVWERTLAAKREEAERADDPEAQFEEMIWGPEKRMMRLAERRRRQDELAAREMSGTGEAVAEAIRRRMQRGQSHD
jgi:hypothetical protein